MIKVFITSEQKRYRKIRVSGHADYNIAGQDIVCASVSALLAGLLNGLEHFCEQGFIYEIRKDGYAEVLIRDSLSDITYDRAHIIIKTFELGILMIEQDYPDYVETHIEEVDNND